MNFLDLADDLVVGPPEIRDGRAAAPDAAGIGVEIDEERLQRYRVDALMLFMAEMEVRLPPDMPPEQADELKARERAYSQGSSATAAGRTCGASPGASRT